MRIQKVFICFYKVLVACLISTAGYGSASITRAFDDLPNELVMISMKRLRVPDFIAFSLTSKRFQRLSHDTQFRFPENDLEAVLNFLSRDNLDPEEIVQKIARTPHSTRILYQAFLRVYQDHPDIMAERNVFTNFILKSTHLIQRIETFSPYWKALYLASLLGDAQAIRDHSEIGTSLQVLRLSNKQIDDKCSIQWQNDKTDRLSDLIEEIAPLESNKAIFDHNYRLVLFWHDHFQPCPSLCNKVIHTRFYERRIEQQRKTSTKSFIGFCERQATCLEEEIRRQQIKCLKKKNRRFDIPGSPSKMKKLIQYKVDLIGVYGEIIEQYTLLIDEEDRELMFKKNQYIRKICSLGSDEYILSTRSKYRRLESLSSLYQIEQFGQCMNVLKSSLYAPIETLSAVMGI